MKISQFNEFLAGLTAVCLLVSCEDNSPTDFTPSQEAHYLSLSHNELTFGASAELEKEVSVSALGASWKFTGFDNSWLSVSPEAGNTDAAVTFMSTTNVSPSIRTCIAQLVSTQPDFSYSRALSVTQNGAVPYINTESSDVTFTAGGGAQTIGVTANLEWKVSTGYSWLTTSVAADSKTVEIKAEENLTGAVRTGKVIVFSAEADYNVSEVITVTQLASALPETNTATMEVGFAGGGCKVSISSEVSWTVTASASWVDVSPAEGDAGTTDFSIIVAPNISTNSRKAYVSVNIGGVEQLRITISQEGISLRTDVSSLSFISATEQHTIQITSNAPWKVQSKPEWITTSIEGASGNAELTVIAADNPSSSSRSGVLTIGYADTDISIQVNLMQQGKYFSMEPTAFAELASKGGTHLVHIATDDHWLAVSSSSWMQLSQLSGFGNIDITMTIPDNPSLNNRTDTTTFTPDCALPVHLVTKQAGRYLHADVSALHFFKKGGVSEVVTVSTDATYSITSSVSWLTVHQTGNTFTVEASENDSEGDREGKIVIEMTDLQEGESFVLEIPVMQKLFAPGIDVNGFGEDNPWNIEDCSVKIVLTGFGQDKAWELGGCTVTITVTGFSDDAVWGYTGSSVTIGISGFGEDNSWEFGNDTVVIHMTGFPDDINWD